MSNSTTTTSTNNSNNESIVSEVIAASLGGAFSASVLYPLEVLKTKMQSETKSKQGSGSITCSGSTQTQETERGCTCTCACAACSGCVKKKKKKKRNAEKSQQDEDQNDRQEQPQQQMVTTTMTPTQEPTNASPSSSSSSSSSSSMIAYAKSMYQTGGIQCFYSGVETSAIQSATEKALYFFAYTVMKNLYRAVLHHGTMMGGMKNNSGGGGSSRSSGGIPTVPNLILGCMAEWAHLPITLPIDCLTTKIQTDHSGKGAIALLTSMLSEKGMAGMYKGIQAYTVLCLKPAIQYTVFEQVKRIVLLGRHKSTAGGGVGDNALSAIEAFFLGMVARTVATIVVFPYLRAKVMLQSTYASSGGGGGGADNKGQKKPSIPAMLGELYAEGGVSELFRGLGPELTRGVLSAALMMMAKEKIAVIVKAMLSAGTGGQNRLSRPLNR